MLSLQRQAMMQGGHNGHIYGSPIDNDDTSSVGSTHSPIPGTGPGGVPKRERSGSMGSVGSNGSVNYEMGGVMGGGAGVPRRMTGSTQGWDESMGIGGGMAGLGPMGAMGGMGLGGRGAPAISVGGGGNAQGYAAMML